MKYQKMENICDTATTIRSCDSANFTKRRTLLSGCMAEISLLKMWLNMKHAS